MAKKYKPRDSEVVKLKTYLEKNGVNVKPIKGDTKRNSRKA